MTQLIQFPQNCVKRLLIFLIIAFSCFSIFAAAPFPLHAAGVVSTCDETHLRAALAGGGTVSFGCSGVITLTQTIEIAPNLPVAIEGSGQAVTLSGNQETPVFYVPETAKLTLLNLTIADGVMVPLGGGILNRGAVTVTNSTFTNNWAYGGGAIANTGTLLVQNSTFALNTADGGGFNSSGGGGILNYQGVVTITNSTFTDNVCVDDIGGALYNVAGTVRVTNVTLAGNRATAGGSIANAGTLVVQNSLVTNSPAGGNCSGTLAAASTHNLSDDDTCGASFVQVDAATINLGALAQRWPNRYHRLERGQRRH
ncbi:MAG: right-handed parallel beta-helix repeat-containing protein [Caldilineaceae bacterium]